MPHEFAELALADLFALPMADFLAFCSSCLIAMLEDDADREACAYARRFLEIEDMPGDYSGLWR